MERAPAHHATSFQGMLHLPLKLPARDDALRNNRLSAPAGARTALKHHVCQRDDVFYSLCNQVSRWTWPTSAGRPSSDDRPPISSGSLFPILRMSPYYPIARQFGVLLSSRELQIEKKVINVLTSSPEPIFRTLDSTRAYSRHLTAAS